MRYTILVILACVLLASCTPLPSADSLDGLLARVERAYGATAQIQAMRQSGLLYSTRSGNPARITRMYVYPARLRVDITYPDGRSEQRILNAEQGWRQGQPTQGPSLDAMRLQAARLGLPRLLREQREHVRELSPASAADGSSRRVVELELEGNLRVVAVIDPGTGHIVSTEGILGSSAIRMVFGATYEDFREHKDGLFAFKETHSVLGRNTGVTVIESVELLPGLDGDLFIPNLGLQ